MESCTTKKNKYAQALQFAMKVVSLEEIDLRKNNKILHSGEILHGGEDLFVFLFF